MTIETLTLTTGPGLVFDAFAAGPADGPLVLMLHGYPQSRHSWRQQLPVLAGAGYRVVAPDQRGYSPNARPDPADLANYHYDRLVQDALDLAAAAGCGDRRFHLVGHDWGGAVAWGVADRQPQRLLSLAILSRPHPQSFIAALAADPEQQHRSRHHKAFLNADTARLLLEDDARRLRRNLAEGRVPAEAIEQYVAILGTMPAMEAALAWYRAQGGIRSPVGPIAVPTLYVWGDADATVGRAAAEGTGQFITGPYRFAVLPGIGHFASDEAPGAVGALLLAHLARHEEG